MIVVFTPWKHFGVRRNDAAIRELLHTVGTLTKKKMVVESLAGKSGRVYGSHVASAPGEYPASHHGRLSASYVIESNGVESVTVGTNVPYSRYLRAGTSKMAPRQFLMDALKYTLANNSATTGQHFAEFYQ